MSAAIPRMRMFAGPNVSGKSVLKSSLPAELLGVYLNPDEIEAGIRETGFLDLKALGIGTTAEEVLPHPGKVALLAEAIRHTSRAYLFDNSTDNADRSHTWLAEITDGRTLELKTDSIPRWFKQAVLDKLA